MAKVTGPVNGRAGVKSQPVRLQSPLLGEFTSLGRADICVPTLKISGRKARGGIEICVCLRGPSGEKQAPSPSAVPRTTIWLWRDLLLKAALFLALNSSINGA